MAFSTFALCNQKTTHAFEMRVRASGLSRVWTTAVGPHRYLFRYSHTSVLRNTDLDVSVEQQLLCKQGHVFVLELVSRQQFGGAVAELQTVAFGGALQVAR